MSARWARAGEAVPDPGREPRAARDLHHLRHAVAAQFDDQEVAGAYAVDDEGVSAQDVTLCEKGVMKTL